MGQKNLHLRPLGAVIAASWVWSTASFSIAAEPAPIPVIPGGLEVGSESIKFATGNLQVAGQTSVLKQSTTGLGDLLRASNSFAVWRVYFDFDRMNRADRFCAFGNDTDGDQPRNVSLRYLPAALPGGYSTRRGKIELITRKDGSTAQITLSSAAMPVVSGWYDIVAVRSGDTVRLDVFSVANGTKVANGAASAVTNANFGIDTFGESHFYIGDTQDVAGEANTSTARGSDANAKVGWEGAIAFLGWGNATTSDTDWQEIALGADPLTRIGLSNFKYYRRLRDTTLASRSPVAGTGDTSAACTVIGAFLPGGTPGRQHPTDYITLDPVPDYHGFGVDPVTRDAIIPVSGKCNGVTWAGVFTQNVMEHHGHRREARYIAGVIQVRYINDTTLVPLTPWQQACPISVTGVTEGRSFTENSRSAATVDVIGNGQSQQTILCEGTSLNNTLSTPSFSLVRREVGAIEPSAVAFQTRPEVGNLRTSDALAEMVKVIQSRANAFIGRPVAVRYILNAVAGTSPLDMIDDWVRGGLNTIDLLAYAGSGVTVDLTDWHSAVVSEGANYGNNILGAIYLGTGPYATANQMPDIRRANARIAIAGTSRETITTPGPFDTDQSTGVGAVRASARAWAAANGAAYGPEQIDIRVDTGQGPHQSTTSLRGNVRKGGRQGETVARALGFSTSVDPSLGSPQFNAGKASFRLTATLPNAGSSLRVDNAATYGSDVQGFEISTDGGSTWSRSGFTATFSGTTVTLTKSSGNWSGVTVGNMRVRYAFGGPFSYGTSEEGTEKFRGLLYDGTAIEGGLGLPVRPLAATVVAEP